MSNDWVVIVDSSCGGEGFVARRAAAAMRGVGVAFTLREAKSHAHVAACVAEGFTAGATRFVAVGGDGAAHMVVNSLMEHQWVEPPTLAILPAGSGSDFIRTFALPRQLEETVKHLTTSDLYPCDIARLEGSFGVRHFLNVADVGVIAASNILAKRLLRFLGNARYSVGFWLAMARYPARQVRLVAGNRTYEGPAYNVVVANGQYSSRGMNIAPQATVMDGKFDIQVFEGPRRLAFSVMPRVAIGTHVRHHGVKRYVADSFTLEAPGRWPITTDGKALGKGSVSGVMLRQVIKFKI